MITGKKPEFKSKNGKIVINTETLNFFELLKAYVNNETMPEMIDFLRQLLVIDPANRLTPEEGLNHRWLCPETSDLNIKKFEEMTLS